MRYSQSLCSQISWGCINPLCAIRRQTIAAICLQKNSECWKQFMSKGSSAKSGKCCQELNVMMLGYQRVDSIVKIVRHTKIPSEANDDI